MFIIRGLPLITYAPRGRGGGRASYTFLLRITCKKGGEGVQKACKNAYVINGRPLISEPSFPISRTFTSPERYDIQLLNAVKYISLA